MRILRWTEQLRCYPNLVIKYLLGKENHMADMLSRFTLVVRMQEVGSIQAETDITENLVNKINAAINVKQDELRKATVVLFISICERAPLAY